MSESKEDDESEGDTINATIDVVIVENNIENQEPQEELTQVDVNNISFGADDSDQLATIQKKKRRTDCHLQQLENPKVDAVLVIQRVWRESRESKESRESRESKESKESTNSYIFNGTLEFSMGTVNRKKKSRRKRNVRTKPKPIPPTTEPPNRRSPLIVTGRRIRFRYI